ncbi:ABC transporter substrate-binding protein [Microbacterium thalassium]|uniref:Raffinose/stachyose/melibiose transport system substrate-binding protein n=1 Tax=Microbacterium thalassium TaxID=362649 RepID=A0A7X0FQ94_9MICO|nr:ABC transporter substrate-binding protein [Microbacterium thalassium]MBB6391611.1 raffinose/stachyose/melibiose transport system substrate-binding protein [Microbacterium thalassium]GLK24214.1 ABC transporter substrate-binding protein [Microbacterium thalassium]
MIKRRMATVVAAGIAVTALTAGLAGCSSGGSDDGGDGAEGKVYFLNFKPEVAEQWVELAAEYTAETGVQVDVQTAASGTYETTLKSEMAKSDAPTLFQVNGPVGLANWEAYAADISDSSIYSHLKDQSVALTGDDGAVLAVPYVQETYGIIYNKALLEDYFALPDAEITSIDELNNFDALKSVAEGIQANKDELGVDGAFSSAGFDASSDWRFKTHLANIPLYWQFKADGVTGQPATVTNEYLDGYQDIFDLYINNSTTERTLLSGKTMEDSTSEFALGQAVFYQNGTWAYGDVSGNAVADEDLGMMPIYIGAEGEEDSGLATGSENYWVINGDASEADQQATDDFLDWVITSDTGRDTLANTMGFVTPFDTMDDYLPDNPFVLADAEYTAAGKTAVTWNFTVMPSEEWKNNLGQALLQYAQETGSWDDVETAFVDGWATEYELANG